MCIFLELSIDQPTSLNDTRSSHSDNLSSVLVGNRTDDYLCMFEYVHYKLRVFDTQAATSDRLSEWSPIRVPAIRPTFDHQGLITTPVHMHETSSEERRRRIHEAYAITHSTVSFSSPIVHEF
jgi:hypothetical protein